MATSIDQLPFCVGRVLGPSEITCGTGFLIDSRGLFVTCAHVVELAGIPRGGMLRLQFGPNAATETVHAILDDQLYVEPARGDLAFARLMKWPKDAQWLPLGGSAASSNRAFQTYGFPYIENRAGLWGQGDIIGPRWAEFSQLQLGNARQITSGFSGAPLFDVTSRRVVGMVVSATVPTPDGRLVDTAFAIPGDVIRAAAPELELAPACPYRDLDPFSEADSALWFGDVGIVDAAVQKIVAGARCITILGASGSGKSSLIAAGLIPALKAAPQCMAEHWHLSGPFRPASVFWPTTHPRPARTILVIDQVEDLIVNLDAVEREAVIANLAGALSDPQVTVVLGVRLDYFARLIADSRLTAPVTQNPLALPIDLTPEQLADCIARPALENGLQFDPPETPMKIATMAAWKVPGRVVGTTRATVRPLLQVALTRLWELRSHGVLTWDAFKKGDCFAGPLVHRAEAVFSTEGFDQQLAERILLALIDVESVGAAAKGRRRGISGLRKVIEEDRFGDVFEALVRARLLIASSDEAGKEYVELIHDSLITEWPRLSGLIVQRRAFLAWHSTEEDEAGRWEDAKRRGERRRLLLRGPGLAEAFRYRAQFPKDLGPRVGLHIHASSRAQTYRRIAVFAAFGILAATAVLMSVMYGYWKEQFDELEQTKKQRDSAEAESAAASKVRQAGRWVSQSENEAPHSRERVLDLAYAVRDAYDDSRVWFAALREAMDRSHHVVRLPSNLPPYRLAEIAASANHVVTLGVGGTLESVHVQTGVRTNIQMSGVYPISLSIDRDGTRVAAILERELVLANLDTAQVTDRFPTDLDDVRIAPNGDLFGRREGELVRLTIASHRLTLVSLGKVKCASCRGALEVGAKGTVVLIAGQSMMVWTGTTRITHLSIKTSDMATPQIAVDDERGQIFVSVNDEIERFRGNDAIHDRWTKTIVAMAIVGDSLVVSTRTNFPHPTKEEISRIRLTCAGAAFGCLPETMAGISVMRLVALREDQFASLGVGAKDVDIWRLDRAGLVRDLGTGTPIRFLDERRVVVRVFGVGPDKNYSDRIIVANVGTGEVAPYATAGRIEEVVPRGSEVAAIQCSPGKRGRERCAIAVLHPSSPPTVLFDETGGRGIRSLASLRDGTLAIGTTRGLYVLAPDGSTMLVTDARVERVASSTNEDQWIAGISMSAKTQLLLWRWGNNGLDLKPAQFSLENSVFPKVYGGAGWVIAEQGGALMLIRDGVRQTPLKHSEGIQAANFSLDGRWLAVVNAGGGTVIYDLRTHASIRFSHSYGAAFSPDGHYLALNHEDRLIAIDLDRSNVLKELCRVAGSDYSAAERSLLTDDLIAPACGK